MKRSKNQNYRLETSHIHLSSGETVAMLRGLMEWTQADLSRASGIAATNISQIENGRLALGKQRAVALAEALGVHPVTLLFPDYPMKKAA